LDLQVDVESQHRDTFRINYVYGFSSSRFSYFITNQRPAAVDSALQDMVVSRVVRVCQGNAALTHSYAEVPIECRRRNQVFKVVQAATVTHVGSRLAKLLGLSDEGPSTDLDHVLVAVFSRQSSSSTASAQQMGSAGSMTSSASRDSGNQSLALCVIPVVVVRRTFTSTIQKCFGGRGNTGPDYIVRPVGCTSTVSTSPILTSFAARLDTCTSNCHFHVTAL
jgi:Sema domain